MELHNPLEIESTTKQAFSKCKAAMTSPDKEKDGHKFSISARMSTLKQPKSTSDLQSSNANSVRRHSKDEPKRKRTQPYDAPYFWTPPDQVLAMNQGKELGSQQRRVSSDV